MWCKERKEWKQSFVLLASVVLLSFTVFGFGGCGGGGGGGDAVPAEEYSLSDLQGRWNVESGSGSATGPDGTYALTLESGYFDGALLEETASSARVDVDYSLLCRAVHTSGEAVSIPLSYVGEATASKVGTNCYRYVFPGGSQLTITLLSQTQARVEERGNFTTGSYTYAYTAAYSFRKEGL